jgi:two-component system sensor histidine kinase DesK
VGVTVGTAGQSVSGGSGVRIARAGLAGRWRTTDDAARVVLYTRASLWSIGPMVVLFLAADVGAELPLRPGERLVACLVVLLLAGAVAVVVDRQITGLPSSRGVLAAWAATAGLAGLVGALSQREWRMAVLTAAGILCVAPLGPRGARRWLPAAVVAGLVVVVLGRPAADDAPGAVLLVCVLAGLFAVTVQLSVWICDVVRRLARAEQDRARLAVAEERLRFSRDLHDVVGRNLAAIAVTSDLVGELARRGRPEAVERAQDVRRIAQDSLREVREVVRGYRGVDLTTELEGAAGLLRSAGVPCTVQVEGRLDDVPPDVRTAAAWVVREGVTNVVRHASPTWCRVTVAVLDRAVEVHVANDGAGGATGNRSGLNGLAERLVPLGGELLVHQADGQFTLSARLPLAGAQ